MRLRRSNHRYGNEPLTDTVANGTAAAGESDQAKRVFTRLNRGYGNTYNAYSQTRVRMASGKCGCGCNQPIPNANTNGYRTVKCEQKAWKDIVTKAKGE